MSEATERDARAEVGGARVRALLGVGAHGTSFLAESEEHGEVEVWRLHDHAVTDRLRRRLAALRVIADPGLLAIHEVCLDEPQPFLVVGACRWGDPELIASQADLLPRRFAELARALAAAHHFGVSHGDLNPACVGVDSRGRARVDMTRLHVRPLAARTPPPELARGPATDVWALASLFAEGFGEGHPALRAMLDPDPERRPTAADAARAVLAAPSETVTAVFPQGSSEGGSDAERFGIPSRLGPYELLDQLGAGGMGRVFRARDVAGGPDVALKVLLPAWARDADQVARFRREARVLSQLESPYVARFVAANEDAGFHYLVMELVAAESAQSLCDERGKLDVETALLVVGDVARAVSDVHALGLVHRDIKPANVLADLGSRPPRVKLCDFGIARSVGPEAAQLTQDGALGTPAYMAPEQIEGGSLDARADVYALGATLYCLVAGKPPFVGTGTKVMLAHLSEAPAPLTEREPATPRAVSDVVMRCLAKRPDERYPDAAAFHEALMAAWHGAAVVTQALPQPLGLDGKPRVYDFTWSLRATPDELWPHVSNTDRLNRAAGLDDVEWSHTTGEAYPGTEGRFRAAGMELRWKENPFEWVAPTRLGVVREYTAGPFQWLRSTVELNPSGGGTELRHRIEMLPRGVLGHAAATVEVGIRLRRGLERVYRRIDQGCLVARDQKASGVDPFEAPQRTSSSLRARVDRCVQAAVAKGGDPIVLDLLGELVCTGAAPRLARIRPRVWARERGLDEAVALDALLLAAAEGLLEIRWDLLCPTCRIPSGIEESLRALSDHGHCEACDLDFELDMARSVELVFRVHPGLRKADAGVYCIGGPAHSPHVLAQLRLAPGERFALDVTLEPGAFRIAGRGIPTRWSFTVDERAAFERWDLALRGGDSPRRARSLRPGAQQIVLTNDLEHEVVVRLERAEDRDDAVTAAAAAASQRFRQLFPEQVLAPERLVAVSEVALLFARIADAAARYEREEPEMHAELIALSHAVDSAAQLEGGALVKLAGDGVMAVFCDRRAAARAALRLVPPSVGIALHTGPARMTTIGRQLDYFGKTVHLAEEMSRWAEAGEVVVSETVLADPDIAELLREQTAVLGHFCLGHLLVSRARRR
ncbi:MAG: protein kinase [Sandaracinaceae bacterium]|nr:protein kinase [Sandaracinaceae bacterium]